MNKIVIGLALAAVILGTAIALRGGVETRASKEQVAAAMARVTGKPQRLPTDAVLAIAPGIAASKPVSSARMSAVLQQFSTTKTFKDLYERLDKSTARTPEENWVLAQMLEQCAKITEEKADRGPRWALGGEEAKRRFVASVSEKDPNRAKRIAAFDQMNHDLCAGVADVEVSQKDIRKLLELGAAGGDPKARAALVERDLRDAMWGPDGKKPLDPGKLPEISDAQIETLKQSVSSQDPNALLIAVRSLSMPLGNLSLRTGSNELPVDRGAMYGAATLTACEFGYPCGADSRALVQACAMRGMCGANDYREYLFYFANSPSTSQLIGDYQAALSRAARSGDWSYFTFHRGPSPSFAPYQGR
jgi:hypothetical protein